MLICPNLCFLCHFIDTVNIIIVSLDYFLLFAYMTTNIYRIKNKTGYFEVDYISDRKYAYFKRIYLKGITEEEIKNDIAEIYRDFLRS